MMDSRTYVGEVHEAFPTKEKPEPKAPTAGWTWGAVAIVGLVVAAFVAAIVLSLLNAETVGQQMMDTDSSWLWLSPLF